MIFLECKKCGKSLEIEEIYQGQSGDELIIVKEHDCYDK